MLVTLFVCLKLFGFVFHLNWIPSSRARCTGIRGTSKCSAASFFWSRTVLSLCVAPVIRIKDYQLLSAADTLLLISFVYTLCKNYLHVMTVTECLSRVQDSGDAKPADWATAQRWRSGGWFQSKNQCVLPHQAGATRRSPGLRYQLNQPPWSDDVAALNSWWLPGEFFRTSPTRFGSNSVWSTRDSRELQAVVQCRPAQYECDVFLMLEIIHSSTCFREKINYTAHSWCLLLKRRESNRWQKQKNLSSHSVLTQLISICCLHSSKRLSDVVLCQVRPISCSVKSITNIH